MNTSAFTSLSMKLHILLVLACWWPRCGPAQTLSLDQAIELARQQSLSAKRASLRLQVGLWQYRSFKATYLPSVNFSGNVVNYDRSVRSEYDFVDARYEYIFQSNLTNNVRISVDQRISLTGGDIYVDSYLGRLENFGDARFLNFSAIPIRIGLRQPLFGFNEWKWERQLEPLKYELSQREFVADQEAIAYQSVQYFFALAQAQLRYDMAVYDYGNADTLLRIGQERAALGTLTQDDLLELRMALLDAETALSEALLERQQTQEQFRLYLGLNDSISSVVLPETLPQLHIAPDMAWQLAATHNPDMLAYRQQELEAARREERIRRQSRFQAELNAGFGLNKTSQNLGEAYSSPINQLQNVSLSLNVPILDWGRRKGQYKLAQASREVTEAETALARQELQREVMAMCRAFNRQREVVARAAEAASIARQRFQITRRRFLLGNIDLIKLRAATQAQRSARLAYIAELQQYWSFFYRLRQLTLYDFVAGKPLTE